MGNLSKSYLKEKFLSTKGYKRNSPDVNNPYNVIPSNQITMRGVDFPVLGVDNMGNRRLMEPGNDYTFPGNYVTEFPMKNMGSKRFGQVGMQQKMLDKYAPLEDPYAYNRTRSTTDNTYSVPATPLPKPTPVPNVKTPANSTNSRYQPSTTDNTYVAPPTALPKPTPAELLRQFQIAEEEEARERTIGETTNNYYQTPSNTDNTYVRPNVEYKTTLPTPGQIAAEIEQEENRENLLKKVDSYMPALDVATDFMQAGNFVPHPIGQIIGKAGNILGTGVDAYQAYRDYTKGDYGSMGLNIASAVLPSFLGASSFRRNSKFVQPGDPLYPLSPQANILPGGYSRVNYIEPFKKVRGMTTNNLLANRALLGTLGAETIYDAGLFNNKYYTPSSESFRDNTQLSPLYNLKKPYSYQMGGTMGIPMVNGQVVSSQPQPLTSVRRTRGPIQKNNKGDVKTMPKKAVKNILKNIR